MGLLFYGSPIAAVLFCLAAPLFEGKFAEYKCARRRRLMLESFKDALYSISASVAAGRQMPQALEDAARQEELLKSPLAPELRHIVRVYNEAHGKIEELLDDLGKRSGIEEIQLFAASYRICKKSGGDIESVCLRSAYLLIERIDYLSEVAAVLSEKKLDVLILTAMPPAILLFLNITSYEYIALLYESSEGRIVMSLSLCLMVAAAIWSLRIMKLDL